MKKAEAKKRITKLEDQIEELSYRYHVLNDPAVTDDVKDSLEKELRILEQQFPDLVNQNSPVNRVAGNPLEKFKKVKHAHRMLSLNDVVSFDELKSWEVRIKKLLDPKLEFSYFAELKLDGLAVSLIYEDGEFVRGATRGDGQIGEDITQNLRTIQSIPLRLRKKILGQVEGRGEALMSKKTWANLNKLQVAEGRQAFANTRNAAAGSLRQLDNKLAAERNLDFLAWNIILPKEAELRTHAGAHNLLS